VLSAKFIKIIQLENTTRSILDTIQDRLYADDIALITNASVEMNIILERLP